MHVFDVFYEGFFFVPWATLGAQSAQKAPKNGGKMEPKGSPRAPSGKCKNHGRHCTGGIWGGLGEGLGGDFFQTASPDPLWRGLGEHFCRF